MSQVSVRRSFYVGRNFSVLLILLCAVRATHGQDSDAAQYAESLAKAQKAISANQTKEAQAMLDATPQGLRSFDFFVLQERLRRAAAKDNSPLIQRIELPKGVKARYGVLNELNRQMVYICQDGGLRIHDLTDLEKPVVILPHADKSAIWRGVFSHDGKRFFAGHHNGEVVVWDASTWTVWKTIKISTKPIREIAAAPDGSAFVAEGSDAMELWSLAADEAKKVADVGERFNFGEGNSFSPQGDQIATGGMFKITMYDAKTGKPGNVLTHASYTMGLKFSPDGKRIASAPRGNVNKLLAVFDLKSGDKLFQAGPFKNYVAGLAFTPDGKRIAATGCEKLLRIFDASTGQVVMKFDRPVCGAKPAFTRDGQMLGWSEPTGYHYIDLPGK